MGSEVMWSELTWFMWSDFVLKWSEVKWVTVKFLGIKVPCTLRWLYIETTCLYCDYFILYVLCTVVVLTCFVMCGCFGNMFTCIYCVLYCLYCVFFVSFRLCTFILVCFVCTGVRALATEWQLNCSKYVSSNNNNNNTLVWSCVKRLACPGHP